MHTTQSTAPVNWRELCKELVSELQGYKTANPVHDHSLLDRARALLAQPEPEVGGLTDEEVEAWADQQGFIRGHGDHPCGFWIDDGDAGALVRAALARWGRHAPAAEGEVAELVEGLRLISDGMDAIGYESDSWFVARAAALLEQRQAAPVPTEGEVE